MVKIYKSGGTVFISPTAGSQDADISITVLTETAISIRDQLNEMFPVEAKEPCAGDCAGETE